MFPDTEQTVIIISKYDFQILFADTEQMRRIFSNVKETILSIYLDSIGMGDWWITSGDPKIIFSWSLTRALWVWWSEPEPCQLFKRNLWHLPHHQYNHMISSSFWKTKCYKKQCWIVCEINFRHLHIFSISYINCLKGTKLTSMFVVFLVE